LGYDTKDRKKVVYIVDGRGSTEVWNEVRPASELAAAAMPSES
jgi:hypothetical protein